MQISTSSRFRVFTCVCVSHVCALPLGRTLSEWAFTWWLGRPPQTQRTRSALASVRFCVGWRAYTFGCSVVCVTHYQYGLKLDANRLVGCVGDASRVLRLVTFTAYSRIGAASGQYRTYRSSRAKNNVNDFLFSYCCCRSLFEFVFVFIFAFD